MSIAAPRTLFDEVSDFLISGPTPEEIIDYRASEELDERLHELLEKNREDILSSNEKTELDIFINIGHLLTMLKAKAHLKLAGEE